jgi:hypothetical protein
MLGRRGGGGGGGKGAGFDEKVYPVSGEFDDQYSPGGRGIWQILKIVVILHIWQGHSGISGTSGINFATKSRVVSSGKWRGILNKI